MRIEFDLGVNIVFLLTCLIILRLVVAVIGNS